MSITSKMATRTPDVDFITDKIEGTHPCKKIIKINLYLFYNRDKSL